MTISVSRLSAALLTACTLFAAVPAQATNQGEQRRQPNRPQSAVMPVTCVRTPGMNPAMPSRSAVKAWSAMPIAVRIIATASRRAETRPATSNIDPDKPPPCRVAMLAPVPRLS